MLRRTLTGGVLLFFLATRGAGAHEEGVITLSSATVIPGSMLTVEGSDFAEATRFELVLRGALTEYELGAVGSDSDGEFVAEVQVAADVRTGTYKLVAIAPDGDESGSADLAVEAARVLEEGEAVEAEVGSGETGFAGEARAGELQIERDWSGFEWFVVGVLLTGALAGGLVLFRGHRHA